MASDDDEWAMFGSDSEEDDSDDDNNNNDNANNDNHVQNVINECHSNKEEQKTTTTTSPPIFDKAIDEMCLFITKQFITSCRSIPLNQRYFGIPSLLSSLDESQNENNDDDMAKYSLHKKWWNKQFANKITQRGIQLVESGAIDIDIDIDIDSQDRSNHIKYLSDAGNLFCTFEKDHDNADSDQSTTIRESSLKQITSKEQTEEMNQSYERNLRRTLIPGGFLLLTMYIYSNNSGDNCGKSEVGGDTSSNNNNSTKDNVKSVTHLISQWKSSNGQKMFSDSVWDVEHASIVSYVSNVNKMEEMYTIFLMKRPCTVNTLSCPWKTNTKYVPLSFYQEYEEEQKHQHNQQSSQQPSQQKETWLQYERRILADATISISIAELKRCQNTSLSTIKTPIMLTKENIQKAIHAIQKHGFVILPSIFSSTQNMKTIRSWSDAIMSDFHSACQILQSSKEHSVDIFNPGKDDTFDPISYKEMAMREDLRVDLRDGPCIRKLRSGKGGKEIDVETLKQNAYESLDKTGVLDIDDDENGTKPTIIDSISSVSAEANNNNKRNSRDSWKLACTKDNEGNGKNDEEEDMTSLRFNPDILEIVRKLLNPNATNDNNNDNNNSMSGSKIPMYKGNFGRYNFNGSGPNGSPQSLRVGQIGSVISLPQAGDQAIHADTPHIFELYDCLPCHYANVFILGDDDGGRSGASTSKESTSLNDKRKPSGRKVDMDGNFTGDNLVGGTAFIHGTHRLSITAKLTAENSSEPESALGSSSAAAAREKARYEMHMRTIRPSLVVGDALIFDTRVLHFGLANRTKSKCRPMLYVNMTHSWFNDPKNWDDKQRIF